MGEVSVVSYSQWLGLINGAKVGGIRSEEMTQLMSCYPIVSTEEYYVIMQNEIAKLENVLIQKTISRFQTSVNKCLDEYDLENLEHGIREFKKNVSRCFFFRDIEGFPTAVRQTLSDQIAENLIAFANEYMKFVKKLEESGNSTFTEEFEYICKKAKLIKFIEEFKLYG